MIKYKLCINIIQEILFADYIILLHFRKYSNPLKDFILKSGFNIICSYVKKVEHIKCAKINNKRMFE